MQAGQRVKRYPCRYNRIAVHVNELLRFLERHGATRVSGEGGIKGVCDGCEVAMWWQGEGPRCQQRNEPK